MPHPEVCCTQSPCPCGKPLLTHTSAGDTHTQRQVCEMIKRPFPWAEEKLSTRYRSISQWGCLQLSSNRFRVHLSFSPSLQLFLKLIYSGSSQCTSPKQEGQYGEGGGMGGLGWGTHVYLWQIMLMYGKTNTIL